MDYKRCFTGIHWFPNAHRQICSVELQQTILSIAGDVILKRHSTRVQQK